jgi:hypothetical protein
MFVAQADELTESHEFGERCRFNPGYAELPDPDFSDVEDVIYRHPTTGLTKAPPGCLIR